MEEIAAAHPEDVSPLSETNLNVRLLLVEVIVPGEVVPLNGLPEICGEATEGPS